MKKIKFIFMFLLIIGSTLLLTGCNNDSMDNIEIVVTNYPNEYVVKKLYGNHANITSIYPDGVDINAYKISTKQINDISKTDLFVYNGLLEKERDLAVDLLAKNPNLKIIDTAYVLETDYSPEELWLNPSSLLMMSQNVRTALEEYISNAYLKKEVDDAYDELKIELSEIDAEYRVAVDSTDNKTIIVADSALKYLEKFGLNVICIDTDASQKTLVDAENAVINGQVSYIISFKELENNENVTYLLETYPSITKLELHRLDNISDEERSNKETYSSIMRSNLEIIKKELYQ
ncbi:MAG: zinc ABC transporter substrate-binding protein [Bacilli bacterium]|nr:zinc ABC transporter substrate-binding protein [Bacilli bacterium]MBR6137442.1 zinc ABC transporter substrate-binding protein [Bacilli bacterium]